MKKRKKQVARPKAKENDSLTLSDALGDDILEKLKLAKKELKDVENKKEEQRQEEIRRERKEREKNKSFEELLNEYGDSGSKF
ncbi:DUF3886 domain-containing protein [Sporosarcina sp. CAU 1771]